MSNSDAGTAQPTEPHHERPTVAELEPDHVLDNAVAGRALDRSLSRPPARGAVHRRGQLAQTV
jgi:hypothetical protein